MLLKDPQSIMAIGLRFMTSKVMPRVPVADWKTDWQVSTIIEALRECYSLSADDSFVSTYDKRAALYKSMQETVTVDQANIDQLRKSYSERLISALADYGDKSADRESLLLGKFAKVFTHLSNPPPVPRMLPTWPTRPRNTGKLIIGIAMAVVALTTGATRCSGLERRRPLD